MREWSLQDAKARFSELVNVCLDNGPQLVTRHGRRAVVIMSVDEYERVAAPGQGLKDFFLSAPRVDLDIERSVDTGRELRL
jgi:prevent-host-death family protein